MCLLCLSCHAQGVTSYVIIRPVCTALALITSQFGDYAEGSWKPNNAYPYLAMATNVSQVMVVLRGRRGGVELSAT